MIIPIDTTVDQHTGVPCACCQDIAPPNWRDVGWTYATQATGEAALLCPECVEPSPL